MFFSWEKHIISPWGFLRTLRSGQFRRQKSLGPLKKTQEMADYVFFPPKKHKIPHFYKQRYINTGSY
jgi:hypothetical protein